MHMAQLKCYLTFYFTVDIIKNTLTQSPTPLKELEGGKNSEGNLFLFQTNKVDSLLVRLHINGSLSLTNLAMSISSGCLEGATCKIWLCALDTWENNYLCMYSKKSQILTSSGHRNKTILSHWFWTNHEHSVLLLDPTRKSSNPITFGYFATFTFHSYCKRSQNDKD